MPESVSVIAGNGELPLKVLKNLHKRKIRADVIGIKDEYLREIQKFSDRFESIRFYEIDKGIDILKKYGNKNVIFVGGVRKTGFLNIFRPEMVKNLIKFSSLSDEGIFKGIISLISSHGFNVLDFRQYYEEGLTREGIICGKKPEPQLLRDAGYGMAFIKHNSSFSVGQSVVVKSENLIAVETALGTDEMLSGIKGYRFIDAVFVKCPKNTQDERIDIPSVGRKTVDLLIKADIRWVFLEAEKTMIIGDEETIAYAEKRGISICGIKSE